MATLEPRYSKQEFSSRGETIYQRDVQPRLKEEDNGKFVAIDIETADYEIDSDDFTATERLLTRNADAQIWLCRAGQPTAYRIGYGGRRP